MFSRSILLGLGLTFAACSSSRPPVTSTPPAAVRDASAPRAPLVVTVVIDQFAAWVASERVPLLPATGGFARLRREGTWFRQLRYHHATTDTAPGHSSLYTGQSPRESGILANEIPDARGARTSILRDEHARAVTFDGPTDAVSSSIAILRVPTLADQVRESVPGAVIVSVSLKDRGAIFGGGRHPDAVIWYDPGRDAFVTSTAFANALPPWAREHGSTDAVRTLRASPWTLTDESWVRAHAATPDDQPGEADLDGWGTTFPHDFTRARRPAGAMRASPLGDAAVLTLAGDAVEHARDPHKPMLLAISLSSSDYIGHLYGPDAWEAWDQLYRLDASLGRFFTRLDALVGSDGWSLVLAADHGITPLPEVQTIPTARPWCTRDAGADPWERPCGALGRLDPDAVGRELQEAAVAAIGPGTWVRALVDPYVYLTPEATALSPERSRALIDALKARARQHPEVERIVDTVTVPERCPEGESVEALLCRSIPRDSGAVMYLQLRAGAFFDAGYVLGRGTSHGSPYLLDRAVPMFVRAPGVAEAGRTVDEPVPFTRYRETAARLLGL